MAKRRKLTAPTPEDIAGLEAEIAPERPRPSIAPIAQIAASAARAGHAPETPDGQDAALWREADGEGRVMREIPLDKIDTGYIARDRASVDETEMEELRASLRAHGQRLPVEVTALGDGTYGLISGLRRVTAIAQIAEETGRETVTAIVRGRQELADSYLRMVEENEIRSQLTPYERGRIAVVAAGQGVHASTQEAVEALFAAASRAKRSKIRAFASVHEALGDLLSHGPAMGERVGLRIAAQVKEGFAAKLRAALERAQEEGREMTEAVERAVLERALTEAEGRAPAAPGRPRASAERLGRGLRLVAGAEALRLDLRDVDEAGRRDLERLIRDWAERG